MVGAHAVRSFSAFLTVINIILGITLVVRGVAFYKTWNQLAVVIGPGYDIPSTITLSLGVITVATSIFGLMALCLNGYGMMVVYCILLGIISSAMVVYGLIIVMDVKSDQADRMIRLRAAINALPPHMMPVLEIKFKCCGVEKFTDYRSGTIPDRPTYTTTGLPGDSKPPPQRPGGRGKTIESDPFAYNILPKRMVTSNVWNLEDYLESTEAAETAETTVVTEQESNFEKIVKVAEKFKNAQILTVEAPQPKLFSMFGIPDWFPEPIKGVVNWLVDWKKRIINFLGRWLFGWGAETTDEGLTILPYSCCKNLSPHVKCYGDPLDTWQDGCLYKTVWFWKACHLEISILLLCFMIPAVTTMVLAYITKKDVQDKYYF